MIARALAAAIAVGAQSSPALLLTLATQLCVLER